MFMWFNPMYFVFLAPAILLMIWAQFRVKSAYHAGMKIPTPLSGAAAARHMLDQAGCEDVGIEETHGMLSDHYDPRHRVLRLSREVFHSRSATAVGIAAHEAGHALQHAQHYAPLVIRNVAVPAAQFGPIAFLVLIVLGILFSNPQLILFGLVAYGGLLVFQVVNLPVEFDASNRAKLALSEYGIVDQQGAVAVRNVLNAAGWTYVAATLETALTLLYYAMMLLGGSRDD
ncbi:MAG: zinc metallopeptidase [Planctomycetaceae bacterium]